KQSGSSDDELRARLGAAYDRSHYPAGPRRQLAAIIDTGDLRKDYTTRIKAPALVIHGAADPLAPPAGGADIARNINGADLHMIEGMGHDLPKKFLPEISRLIVDHMSSHDERATSTA
ncbi:MAG: alpha/beta hydrolase, partial [Parvularculaceae bacterium]